MKSINTAIASGLLLTLGACSARQAEPPFSVIALPPASALAATSPRLSGRPGGELLLSWLQPGDDTVALRFARLVDGGWSDASTVAESPQMFVNWADLPSVVPLADGHIAAHWLMQSGAHSHAYDIAFAESLDDGASWSAASTPHTDGTATQHGFVSIYPDGGRAGVLWLDGRNMVNEVGDDPAASGMMLLSLDQVVDELVCDCCQTDVAVASSGPIAVYRDRTAGEIRDIYVTRRLDGRWQPGIAVADDRWEIAGCPVNGPSIAAAGERVAVAWFTAAHTPVVKVAVSNDSGASFAAPINVVQGTSLGRAALALLDDGDIAVSWLEMSDASAAVKARRMLADGTLAPTRHIANAAGLSVPQMARVGERLVIAWTSSRPDGSARVDSALVQVDAL